ncbi:ribosome production factor 2 homolog isoform X2 [Babylonia areolata]|uniref:ribosome production factor 2 homolog isoform X2 n=1 Tax=Babylonia areolata TaxID=304850 RepID=UPI003FD406AA
MSQRIVKPKTQRAKRALEHREAKVHENDKMCMLMKGGNTSQLVTQCLKELHMLKKPLATLFKKKNITRPFEDESSLEFFSNRADASLFAFGCHSKKRPNNLILGRLFDGHILDMVEFGVEKFVAMADTPGPKCAAGIKPALIFNGERFSDDPQHVRIKNLLIDFFRGPVVDNIRLAGLEHVISFTAVDGKIFIRNYRVTMKKKEVDLTSMGPSMDLVVRRTKLASDDHFKQATKKPKTAKPKKQKNVEMDVFGTKLGRVHMTPQNLQELPDRRMKRIKHKATPQANDDPPAKKQRTESEED